MIEKGPDVRISVNVFMTLDGVMQSPGSPQEDPSDGFAQGGWQVPFPGESWRHVVDAWFGSTSAVLLGRSTFEMMRSYWPHVTDGDNRVADVLNNGRKYVVSTTLDDKDAAWGDTTVIRHDVLGQVAALKETGEGELQVHGSWQLLRTVHEAGLVDVFRLLQFPVVVGSGKRVFDDPCTPTGFEVVAAQMLDHGIVAYELSMSSFGSTASGAYRVLEGTEAVTDGAEAGSPCHR